MQDDTVRDNIPLLNETRDKNEQTINYISDIPVENDTNVNNTNS